MSAAKKVPLGRRLLAMAVGLTVALLAGEAMVRIAASRTLIYNLEMVRYAKELKIPDPLGEIGHLHRPSATAHLMGVDVSINALGHRGPELGPRKPGTRRVMVLGNSVTMGWGVAFDDVFTSIVARQVGLEIANTAVGNHNTHQERVLFERQYPGVAPDLVVLCYFVADAEPRPPGRNHAILRHSYLAAFAYDRISTLVLAVAGKRDVSSYYRDMYAPERPYFRDALDEVVRIRDRAAQDQVPILVVLIPDMHDLSPKSVFAPLYERIHAGFVARGLPTLDTVPLFREKYAGRESELWVTPGDRHPNAKAHRVIAEALSAELSRPGALRAARP
jgi:hypothetical protein